MKKVLIPIGVILVIIALLVMPLIGSYNSLVKLDEEANNQWAQIDVQLKRRSDLIPNLVNTVKGFAEQEKEVLLGITKARAGLQDAKTPEQAAAADSELTSALGKLSVVVESYPQLKSDQNFIRLQDELAGTENRIAVARKDYNDVVKPLNAKIRSFPTKLLAGMFGFNGRQYFEVKESEKEVPNVEF